LTYTSLFQVEKKEFFLPFTTFANEIFSN
jgi:hypothetical protein